MKSCTSHRAQIELLPLKFTRRQKSGDEKQLDELREHVSDRRLHATPYGTVLRSAEAKTYLRRVFLSNSQAGILVDYDERRQRKRRAVDEVKESHF